jgi:hypothetical protein
MAESNVRELPLDVTGVYRKILELADTYFKSDIQTKIANLSNAEKNLWDQIVMTRITQYHNPSGVQEAVQFANQVIEARRAFFAEQKSD